MSKERLAFFADKEAMLKYRKIAEFHKRTPPKQIEVIVDKMELDNMSTSFGQQDSSVHQGKCHHPWVFLGLTKDYCFNCSKIYEHPHTL